MIDLIKLLFVLGCILILLWRKWNLGVVLLLASAAIGLLFGRSPLGLLKDAFDSAVSSTTLRLVGSVALILGLGALLKATARLDGLVHSLEALIPDSRIAMAIIPSLIGVLPMIGGAIFSAPMVEEIGNHLKADPAKKTYLNYWFRHVWEWILPTYPSLILASALLGVTPRDMALSQWPFTLVAIVFGFFLDILAIPRPEKRIANGLSRNGNLKLLFDSIWPILLVIVLSVLLNVDLLVTLVVTMLSLILVNRLGPGRTWKILKEGVSLKLVLIIMAVMFFRQVLGSTGAVEQIPGALTKAGMSSGVIIFCIPFLAGLLTGLNPGAVGISIPVVLPLLTAAGMNMGAVALVYAGGFIGVLASPLHLCLSLSRDYFKAEWGPIYRLLLPSLVSMVIVAVVLFLRG